MEYIEESRSIPIYADCDILVVGGGCAGQAAAVAAARAGAKNIILMERYGYMGGDVTGGYVIMVPNLSWYNKSFVRGIQEEWFTRLSKIPGAVKAPSLDEIGDTDPAKVYQWKSIHDCVSRGTFAGCKPSQLVRAVYYEPNELKIVMDEMVYEHRDAIKLMYHTWGVRPIMDGNTIKGVIFESKEGRKAITAKVVIDATGDGDLYSQTGDPCWSLADEVTRSAGTALVYRIAGMDWNKWYEWQNAHPDVAAGIRGKLAEIQGFRGAPLPTNNPHMCWVNNNHNPFDCTKIEDQTRTEVETRLSIHKVIDYLKEICPTAWGDAYLYDIAPQLGTRCSRRLNGEYVMSANDFAFARKHDDVIAWHSTICQINDCGPVEIPYRAILPQKTVNLICPGRHISADSIAIDWVNLIPQCVGTGQAAGVAAAVAIADKTNAKEVDIRKVQDILAGEQDVPLPRNSHTDISYTQLCEEKQYVLYTDAAKKAAELGDATSHRQDNQIAAEAAKRKNNAVEH